jgi:hypothetical protein
MDEAHFDAVIVGSGFGGSVMAYRLAEADLWVCLSRRVAKRIFPLPGRGRDLLHHYFSEFFDWNDPPLFKSFLRLDASRSQLRIRCFAARGCLEHEENPPMEDDIRIELGSPRTR